MLLNFKPIIVDDRAGAFIGSIRDTLMHFTTIVNKTSLLNNKGFFDESWF